MRRNVVVMALVLGSALASATAADNGRSTTLSASEIVARNLASRGGVDAWRHVQSLSFEGKLGAGGDQRGTIASPEVAAVSGRIPTPHRLAEEAMLPFSMDLQRPLKSRVEVRFRGQSAIQVYDGAHGWKLRPFLNRLEVEPYTAEELHMASMQSELDGPLTDYAAKGTHIELEGTEEVEGTQNYKIKLTTKSGQVVRVWIDAKTFLDTKIDGQPRMMDGKMHSVEIYYRDYRKVNGLEIPFVLETRVLPSAAAARGIHEPPVPPEKIEIDKVSINPKLEANRFSKPQVGETASHAPGF